MKKLIAAALLALAHFAHAGPIPDTFRPGDPGVFGTSQIDDLQVLSVSAWFGGRPDTNRVNAWGGVKNGAYIGNYPSNTSSPPSNERWTFQILEDGRARIKSTANQALCLTHYGYEYYGEFGAGGRAVKLAACDPDSPSQLFFLQRQGAWIPVVSDSFSEEYLVRAISDPTQCLTVLPNTAKHPRYSPLVMMDCASVSGIAPSGQRFVIGKTLNFFDVGAAAVLKRMADVFALFFYHRTNSNGTSTPVYLKSVEMNLVQGTLAVQDLSGYRKIYFQSPFGNTTLPSYTNGTDYPQNLEVRRWVIDTITQSLTLGAELASSIKIGDFKLKIDGKFERNQSDQAIAGVTVPVLPYRTIWFAAIQQKIAGRYNAKITNDLGYTYEIKDVFISSTGPAGITSCDDKSTSSACVNSWLAN